MIYTPNRYDVLLNVTTVECRALDQRLSTVALGPLSGSHSVFCGATSVGRNAFLFLYGDSWPMVL